MALGTLQAFGDAWFEVSELSLRDIVGIPNSDTSEILLGSFGKRVMPCASLDLYLGTKIKLHSISCALELLSWNICCRGKVSLSNYDRMQYPIITKLDFFLGVSVSTNSFDDIPAAEGYIWNGSSMVEGSTFRRR